MTAAAADLLRFLDLERGYRVRYFQLGNEPDYVGPLNTPQLMTDRHLAFCRRWSPSIPPS